MLKAKVITPEKTVFYETVESLSVATTSGVITVLDKHVPLVSTIRSGELTLRKDGTGICFAVHKGLVNVRPHHKGLTEVVVLLEESVNVEELDEKSSEEALARAEHAMATKGTTEDDVFYQSQIESELTRIRLAKKYHHR